jgi:hypothetical protein
LPNHSHNTVIQEFLAVNEVKPSVEVPLPTPKPKTVQERINTPEPASPVYEQLPIILPEVDSPEAPPAIPTDETAETEFMLQTSLNPRQVEISQVFPPIEEQKVSIGVEEVTLEPTIAVAEQLPVITEVIEPITELVTATLGSTYESEETEINLIDQTASLPDYFEDFIVSVSGETPDQATTEEQIIRLIDLADIETDEEEVKQVTESFIQAVVEINEAVESAGEITETHIETMITAAIELLELVHIDPSHEHIMQIISMTLGEEFVSRHIEVINDRLIDGLGTHERKLWASQTIAGIDQIETQPTLLGRIALQLGLSLQPA